MEKLKFLDNKKIIFNAITGLVLGFGVVFLYSLIEIKVSNQCDLSESISPHLEVLSRDLKVLNKNKQIEELITKEHFDHRITLFYFALQKKYPSGITHSEAIVDLQNFVSSRKNSITCGWSKPIRQLFGSGSELNKEAGVQFYKYESVFQEKSFQIQSNMEKNLCYLIQTRQELENALEIHELGCIKGRNLASGSCRTPEAKDLALEILYLREIEKKSKEKFLSSFSQFEIEYSQCLKFYYSPTSYVSP